jgi:hypothetical protein
MDAAEFPTIFDSNERIIQVAQDNAAASTSYCNQANEMITQLISWTAGVYSNDGLQQLQDWTKLR